MRRNRFYRDCVIQCRATALECDAEYILALLSIDFIGATAARRRHTDLLSFVVVAY